MHSAVHIGGIV